MYEDKGRQVPRHRAVTKRPELVGKLVIAEQYDKDLRRSVRSAYLRGFDGGPEDVLPRLRDAIVLWVDGGRMTITGFETDEVENRSYAQSWYLELCEAEGAPAALGLAAGD